MAYELSDDHERIGGGRYRDAYADPEGEDIVLVPTEQESLRDGLERAFTVVHNVEMMQRNDLPVTTGFEVTHLEDGRAALRGEYREDLEAQDRKYRAPAEDDLIDSLTALLDEGEIAYSGFSEVGHLDLHDGNMLYDTDGNPYIADPGELEPDVFDDERTPHENAAAFLQEHGIDQRVDQYMAEHDLP